MHKRNNHYRHELTWPEEDENVETIKENADKMGLTEGQYMKYCIEQQLRREKQ